MSAQQQAMEQHIKWLQENRLTMVTIKAHLGLHAAGMRHSRMKAGDLLKSASKFTGETYKRGQYQKAHDDLAEVIERLNHIRARRLHGVAVAASKYHKTRRA